MSSEQTFEPPRNVNLVVLSALILLAGAGGMALSLECLAEMHLLSVIAGAAGFVAGAILVATGVLSLAIQSRSNETSQSAIHVSGCLVGLLPPVAAGLAWPILYFGAFIMGVFMMPFVLMGCIRWAVVASGSVARHLSALFGWPQIGRLRVVVLSIQIVAILATLPLFIFGLQLLASLGYKVGWDHN